ncbi:MAG: nucleoside deaminase [Spirosomataceae bacterium]
MFPRFSHEFFMNQALRLAQQAADQGEVPVGALVVTERGQIIGKGYNQTERLGDVTAHAEMLALTAATQTLGGKYLTDCTLYVTLEPCIMCAGALAWAQLDRLVFGASEPKRGFTRFQPSLLHPKTQIVSGILDREAEQLLKSFFKEKRSK